jgi:CDP-2,3-bis-(O-geranylgeranyl)-sn-glycerol synthase
MDSILLLKLLGLIAVANTSPLITASVLGRSLAFPVDSNLTFVDGRRVFGPAKTVRGVITSLAVTTATALVLGMGAKIGFVIAAGAMVGDILSSFAKRRLGIASSGPAVGLDQIPETLLPLLLVRLLFIPLSPAQIAAVVLIFFAGEILLSRILSAINLRDRPY